VPFYFFTATPSANATPSGVSSGLHIYTLIHQGHCTVLILPSRLKEIKDLHPNYTTKFDLIPYKYYSAALWRWLGFAKYDLCSFP
jgi:hypothetical protein